MMRIPTLGSARLSLLLLSVVGAMVVGGCTSTQQVDNASEALRSAEERLASLVNENERLRREIGDLEEVSDARARRVDELEANMAAVENQRREIERLRSQIVKMDDAVRSLPMGPLSAETSGALANLARSFPNLMTYDAERGLLQFRSDLTFGPGSAVVKPEAKQGLEQLARVMATSAGREYYLHIVGHTDSQPISNPQTRAKHATNRHLSVHRAIAVSEALQSASVSLSADRILVGGWGQYDPVVPNNDRGGTAANRRVEIWVVPESERRSSSGVSEVGSAPEPVRSAPSATPAPTREIPIK